MKVSAPTNSIVADVGRVIIRLDMVQFRNARSRIPLPAQRHLKGSAEPPASSAAFTPSSSVVMAARTEASIESGSLAAAMSTCFASAQSQGRTLSSAPGSL